MPCAKPGPVCCCFSNSGVGYCKLGFCIVYWVVISRSFVPGLRMPAVRKWFSPVQYPLERRPIANNGGPTIRRKSGFLRLLLADAGEPLLHGGLDLPLLGRGAMLCHAGQSVAGVGLVRDRVLALPGRA